MWGVTALSAERTERMVWNLKCWYIWSPSQLIRFWSRSVFFLYLGGIVAFWLSETGPNCGYRAFSEEYMRGIAGYLAYWCILTTFRTDYILVTLCIFSLFWWHFDSVKQVKFAVSMHFDEKTWEEWPKILHNDVTWPRSSSARTHCFHFLTVSTLCTYADLGSRGYFGL